MSLDTMYETNPIRIVLTNSTASKKEISHDKIKKLFKEEEN